MDPYFLSLEDYDSWIYGSHVNFLSTRRETRSSSSHVHNKNKDDEDADVHELGKPFLSSFSFSHLRNIKNKWMVEENETIVFEEEAGASQIDPSPSDEAEPKKNKKQKKKSLWNKLKHSSVHLPKNKKESKKKKATGDEPVKHFQDKMAKRMRERMKKEETVSPLAANDSNEACHQEPDDSNPSTETSQHKTKKKQRWLLKKLLSCGAATMPSSTSFKARGKQKRKEANHKKNNNEYPVEEDVLNSSRDCEATAASTEVGSPPPSPSGLSFASSTSSMPSVPHRIEPIEYPTPYPYEEDIDDNNTNNDASSPPASPVAPKLYSSYGDDRSRTETPNSNPYPYEEDIDDISTNNDASSPPGSPIAPKSFSSFGDDTSSAETPKPKKKTFDYRRSTTPKISATRPQPRKNSSTSNPVAAIVASFERFAKSRCGHRRSNKRVKSFLKKIKAKRFPVMVVLGLALIQSVLTNNITSLSLLGGMTTGFVSNTNAASLGCFLQGLTSTMIGGSSPVPQLLP